MVVDQREKIELKNTGSFVEGYEGENEGVGDAKEVDSAPKVAIEEIGIPKSQLSAKPVSKRVATINPGEGYSLEDSEEIDKNLPCSDACKWRRVLKEAIEQKKAA